VNRAGFHRPGRARAGAVLACLAALNVSVQPAGRDPDERGASNGPAPRSLRSSPQGRTPAFVELIQLYAYDRLAPLDLREEGVREKSGVAIRDVSYASPRGGRVPAYLIVPPGPGPFAGIVFMHPAGGANRAHFRDEAVELAKFGAVCITIDAPNVRPPAHPLFRFTAVDRDEIVHAAVDLRRAVDLLGSRPGVDTNRLAYVGFSYGATLGGILSGVEKRFRGLVLMSGGATLTSYLRGLVNPELRVRQDRKFDDYLELMRALDPEHYVSEAAPAAVLFQNGRRDSNATDAERYHQVATEPKPIKWYDAGHDLNAEAQHDRAVWLGRLLTLRPPPPPGG